MTTTDPTTTDTYRKIASRLTMFRPQIDLTKYFAGPDPNVRLYGEKPYIRDQLKKYGVAAGTEVFAKTVRHLVGAYRQGKLQRFAASEKVPGFGGNSDVL